METLAPPKPETTAHVEALTEGGLEASSMPFAPEKKGFGGWVKGLKEKYFSPADSITEGIEDPTIAEQVAALDATAETLSEDTLRKVEAQLGSNEGGWYERPSTGERFYIKFYENPDQAKVEFIANAVYEKLGIKAVKSELIEVDGREAIASPGIADPQPSYRDEQKGSSEVRDGFIADAYLANWDVAGLNYDNIVRGEDGMYRVDNGGSMIFRAQGGHKDFPSDGIPELETMLNPQFTSGQVFEGITPEEMASQARALVEKLDPETIDTIIAESGLTGETAQVIKDGLVGRREFLVEHFGLAKAETERQNVSRLRQIFERFEKVKEQAGELGIRARTAILSDSRHLENQEISFIDTRDEGFMSANFKLTAQQFRAVQVRLQEMQTSGGGADLREGKITYRSFNDEQDFVLAKAIELDYDGLIVKVAIPTVNQATDDQVRAAMGLVSVEIPYDDTQPHIEDIEARVNDVLVNLLGVPEGLAQPTPEAEAQYKEARYRWHHKLPYGPPSPKQALEVAQLQRQEVFPGYHTMVSEGKHHEYEEKYGEFASFHAVASPDTLIKVLQNGGLMSSHERFRRGLLVHGVSSVEDFRTGGADSVFVRTVVDKSGQANKQLFSHGPTLVMGPELYDRTDWYAYDADRFGTTGEGFEYRQSPEEIFKGQIQQGYSPSNEQMFRTGIPTEAIKAIACNNSLSLDFCQRFSLEPEIVEKIWQEGPNAVRTFAADNGLSQDTVESYLISDTRMVTIDALHKAGITEVNGVAVEQFVVSTHTIDDYIDVSHGRTPRSRQPAESPSQSEPHKSPLGGIKI